MGFKDRFSKVCSVCCLRLTFVALMWVLVSLFPAIPVSAQSIVVLKSRELDAFDEVIHTLVTQCANMPANQIVEYNLKGEKQTWEEIVKQAKLDTPKLILAMGPLAAQVAKEAGLKIPVVFCMVSNPYRYGLAGENLVGISMDVPGELQFKLYKSVVPHLKTIGVIYDPEKSEELVAEAALAAEKLGLVLLKVPVTSPKRVPDAMRSLLGKIDALWMVPDDTVLTTQSFRYFLVTSFEKKLPFLAISDIFVKVGALATIAPDPDELGRQICRLISQIQNGQLDLKKVNILSPVETQLVINVKTAEKIGLVLSPEILQSASKLYQ